MRTLLKRQGFTLEVQVTDKLGSYGELGLSTRHEQGLRKTIGLRIRTRRCDDASSKCKRSSRRLSPAFPVCSC
jgi:hypothetical protein